MHDALLLIENGTIEVNGTTILEIDFFAVGHTELRSVVGPDGPGKALLCDVISGHSRLHSGRMILNGSDITHCNDVDLQQRGIARTVRVSPVFGHLTVAENLELSSPISRGVLSSLFRRAALDARDTVIRTARTVRLGDLLDVRAHHLNPMQRQALEIGTLLVAGAKLLVIDSPALGLTPHERHSMALLLRRLSENQALIILENDMDFVNLLDGSLTVLSEGKVLTEGPASVFHYGR